MNKKEFKETKKKKSILKSTRGITLIALVVTIVVLLILAGVSISLILDNNGIIQKSKDAKEKYGQAKANEQKQLDNISDWIDETTDNINWDKILNGVIEDPDGHRHPDQSNTNPDVGVGTDGKPVNLDLWYYRIINSGTGIALNESAGSGIKSPGYSNANITEEGTIIGKMPQYIYIYSENKIYPVTHAGGVFYGCTNLVIAPEFPETVISIESAFAGCVNLKTAPTIPESVTGPIYINGGMYATFYGCKKLTGHIRIDANPSWYWQCFMDASTAEGANLVVSGSSTMLDEIIATKSDNSNITKGE